MICVPVDRDLACIYIYRIRYIIVMLAQVYNIIVSVACGESYEKQENDYK